MQTLSSGYKAWIAILDGIRSTAEYGGNSYLTNNISTEFRIQLTKLGYKITYTAPHFNISWDQEPTIQDYDTWINELIVLRDSLKKQQLIGELAGI